MKITFQDETRRFHIIWIAYQNFRVDISGIAKLNVLLMYTVTLDKLLFNIQRLCHYPKPQSGNYWNNDIHQLKSNSLWENILHFFSFKVSSHMCFHDYCNQTVYSFSTSK